MRVCVCVLHLRRSRVTRAVPPTAPRPASHTRAAGPASGASAAAHGGRAASRAHPVRLLCGRRRAVQEQLVPVPLALVDEPCGGSQHLLAHAASMHRRTVVDLRRVQPGVVPQRALVVILRARASARHKQHSAGRACTHRGVRPHEVGLPPRLERLRGILGQLALLALAHELLLERQDGRRVLALQVLPQQLLRVAPQPARLRLACDARCVSVVAGAQLQRECPHPSQRG